MKTIEDVEGINFDRMNVTDYIADLKEPINDENKEEVTKELQKLSNDESFDQNDAIEDIISETNKLDPEKTRNLLK